MHCFPEHPQVRRGGLNLGPAISALQACPLKPVGALPSRYCAGTMPWGHPGEHHDFEPQRHDDGYLEVIGFTMTSLVSGPAQGPPSAPALLCPWPCPHSAQEPGPETEGGHRTSFHWPGWESSSSPPSSVWGLSLPLLSVGGVTLSLFSSQSIPGKGRAWGPSTPPLAPDLSLLCPQAALQVGGHGERLTQCREVLLTTSKAIPVQVDGEPI